MVWYGPAQLSNGGELVEIHTPPAYPGIALVYSWPAGKRKAEPTTLEELKASDAAQWDVMAAERRAEARRLVGDGSRVASTSLEVPPVKPARKPRRTKQQMADHRASVAARIESSRKELLGDEMAAWLDEPDPLVESIINSTDA